MLERINLQGQPATVAYFDAQMALTTPAAAVFAKAVFDNGRRAFYRVSPREIAKYSPNQPRVPAGSSEGGQFASAFGGMTAEQILTLPSSAFTPANPEGINTQRRFKTSNGYTPEREALHQVLIEKALASATPVEHPESYVLGGGPATGKSSKLKPQLHMPENIVTVDADSFKLQLPEFREGVTHGGDTSAGFVHDESGDIARALTARAVRESYHVLLDGTGNNSVDNLEDKVAVLRRGGRSVVANYGTVAIDEALRRAKKREAEERRGVAPKVVAEIHRNISTVFPQILDRGIYDEVTLWDLTGEPKRVLTAHHQRVTVHEPMLYQAFLDKAKMPTKEFHAEHGSDNRDQSRRDLEAARDQSQRGSDGVSSATGSRSRRDAVSWRDRRDSLRTASAAFDLTTREYAEDCRLYGDIDLAEALTKSTVDASRDEEWPAPTETAARFERPLSLSLESLWTRHIWAINEDALALDIEARRLSAIVQRLDYQGADRVLVSTLSSRLTVAFLEGARLANDSLADTPLEIARAIRLDTNLAAIHELAVAWAEAHAGALVVDTAQIKEAIRVIIADSLAHGIAPRDVARILRETIGLTPQQRVSVQNFQARLIAEGETDEKVARRVARYAEARRRSRALTIARTELIAAVNSGQQEAWRDAVRNSLIDPERMKRRWITTPDERLEPFCEALDGVVVGIEEPFNASGLMGPPAHPNCRCAMGLVRNRDSR